MTAMAWGPEMESLVMIGQGDLVGLSRSKAVPLSRLEAVAERGVGWVPANMSLDPFGGIAPNPWGPLGGLRLMPEPERVLRVERPPGLPPFQLVLCDLVTADGQRWESCPRTLLSSTLAELEARTGCRVVAAFEHEFQLDPQTPSPHHDSFSPPALSAVEPYPSVLADVLARAGLKPEMVFSEYGSRQFEVPIGVAEGVEAADRALIVRELVREAARWYGRRASFAPVGPGGGVGNGVHVHLSLVAQDGTNLTQALATPVEEGDLARAFVGGMIAHAGALCAFSAPSPVSYLRLLPGHWSAAHAACGIENREVMVRFVRDPVAPESSHLEFRAADSTGSPYLVLAALVRAGLAGIDEGIREVPWCDEDPASLDDGALASRGIERLPSSLGEALEALAEDRVLGSWMPAELGEAYSELKRHELELARADSDDELLERYGRVY